MDVFEAIKNRHSVRKFKNKDVEEEKLNRILEAARFAPSASNRQEWRFVVIRNPETRKKMIEVANGQSFIGEAPVVLACCAETDGHVMACGQQCYPIDVAIAMEHIALQAVSEGLGTCWIGAFSEDKARKVLGIPEHIRVVELMPLGYPDTVPRPKNRKELSEIVRYESW